MGEESGDGELGKLYAFPDVMYKPVCSDCEHIAFGAMGGYCVKFEEEIWSESIAEMCGDFDPMPWAGKKEQHDVQ